MKMMNEPNEVTIAAIDENLSDKKRYTDLDELWKDLEEQPYSKGYSTNQIKKDYKRRERNFLSCLFLQIHLQKALHRDFVGK